MAEQKDVLIFVPGIMGSELKYSLGRFFGDVTVWLSPTKLVAGGFRLMRLPVDGEGGAFTGATKLRPGFPLGAFYGPFVDDMTRRGWDVQMPAADWRHPVAEDGQRLVDTIRGKTHQYRDFLERCSVVCHSRGGLVTRWALKRLADAGELWRVRRVVGCAVPHRGSLNAVLFMSGQHDMVRRIVSLGRTGQQFGFGGIGIQDTLYTIRSWPALYELLPDPGRAWFDPAVAAALYQAATWEDCDPEPVTQYLTDAAAAWRSLPDPPPEVEWIDVAGVGVMTAVGIASPGGATDDSLITYTRTADGTVPLPSAHVPGRRLITVPCQHDVLMCDGRLWGPIDSALNGQLQQDYEVRGDVLNLG